MTSRTTPRVFTLEEKGMRQSETFTESMSVLANTDGCVGESDDGIAPLDGLQGREGFQYILGVVVGAHHGVCLKGISQSLHLKERSEIYTSNFK